MSDPDEPSDPESFINALIDIMLLGFVIMLVVLLVGCVTDPRPRAGHVYDTHFGAVYCGSVDFSPCGLMLSDCHDTHTYGCMTNVRERGE